MSEPNKNGVYEAKVEIYNSNTGQWQEKGPYTTMFPDSWSESRIKQEISGAWNSSDFNSQITKNGTEWSGTSPSGIKIKGYIKNNGTTAYPIYQGVE